MKLLVELAQLAIALAVSSVVAVLVGPTYLAVGALVLATCMVLLYEGARQQSMIVEEPIGIWATMQMVGTSVVFGLIWPAIPLIFTWRRGGPKVDDA